MCTYRQHLVGGLVYVYLQTTPGWRVSVCVSTDITWLEGQCMCIYRQHLVGGLVYVYIQTTPGWRVSVCVSTDNTWLEG